MKQFFILLFVSLFLFSFGQALFTQKPADSSEEAVMISSDMRRGKQAGYLMEQARRFYRQGRFDEAYEVVSYVKDRLNLDSPEISDLLKSSREQLEESALAAAEKSMGLTEMVDAE